jgi:hypothetical protein
MGSYVGEYLYLPYLAAYVIFLFLAVVFICNMLFDTKDYALFSPHRNRKRYKKKNCISCFQICRDCYHCFCCCCINDENHCCGVEVPLFLTETLYNSRFGTPGVFILLFTRILSFLYLIYVVIIPFFHSDNGTLDLFSSWVNIGMCIIFLFLMLGSFLHVAFLIGFGEEHGKEMSIWIQRVTVWLHFLFETVLVNALFVTIMEYLYLHNKGNWGTAKGHLIPTLLMIVDGVFNTIPVRLEHYQYCATLGFAYLIYMWLSIIEKKMDWSTYPFLQVERPRCFGNYTVVFAIHFACFLVMFVLYKIRDYQAGIKYETRYRMLKSEKSLYGGSEYDEAEGDEEQGGKRARRMREIGIEDDEEEEDDGEEADGGDGDVEFSDVYASRDPQDKFVGSADDADDHCAPTTTTGGKGPVPPARPSFYSKKPVYPPGHHPAPITTEPSSGGEEGGYSKPLYPEPVGGKPLYPVPVGREGGSERTSYSSATPSNAATPTTRPGQSVGSTTTGRGEEGRSPGPTTTGGNPSLYSRAETTDTGTGNTIEAQF